jgi:hypothetical protein
MIAFQTSRTYSFFRKLGFFSPNSDEAIKIPSRFVRVSSFFALMTHQIETRL